ncbi:hypothetical protein [Aureimonas sp. N4]|uniref:hypothetical protein n=1 Tax=Aureimonas sp. N4 TaxID=1638165 RepID=UPI000785DEA9|nr:hypothetical protein [Aureimonas sp. N4]
MSPFAKFTIATVAAIVGTGVYVASVEPVIYEEPLDYIVERTVVGETERVVVTAPVRKLRDCDLDRGDGPLWVEFYDGKTSVPPISAFFKPDGTQAGRNVLRKGEAMVLDGYSATIPHRMHGFGGTFVVMVPCETWTVAEDGERVWGRKVTAEWGPLPVPPPGMTAESTGGHLVFTARAGGTASTKKPH